MGHPFAPKIDFWWFFGPPGGPPKRPKLTGASYTEGLGSHLGSILAGSPHFTRFWLHLGSILDPKWSPEASQSLPKSTNIEGNVRKQQHKKTTPRYDQKKGWLAVWVVWLVGCVAIIIDSITNQSSIINPIQASKPPSLRLGTAECAERLNSPYPTGVLAC